MRAAIYARRSTEEHQAESLDVQVSEATRYIEQKGWSLHQDHVFIDDAVSRAEFKKRPGLVNILLAVEQNLVDVVVVRDETRLGGDMYRTSLLISNIIDGGASLYYYFSDERVTIDNAVEKFMVMARNFAAELEREKISQRTHEHLLTKARRGLNAGGRCYGYDNVEITDDQGRRIRVEYAINLHQSEVVREIFRQYADGQGLRSIAVMLNDRGEPFPKAGKRGTGSWAIGAVREMLKREMYNGVRVWNRTMKTYRGGTKVRVMRPESEWERIPVPQLKIIDDDLWNAVQARFNKRKAFNGGKGRLGPPSRHLLTGFARCSECGGPMCVSNRRQNKESIKVYSCAYHRERGNSVCTNTVARPVETVDSLVTSYLKRNMLTEDIIIDALKVLRRRLDSRKQVDDSEIPRLEDEIRKREAEITTFMNAMLEAGSQPSAIVEKIASIEAQVSRMKAHLESLKTAPSVLDMEVRRMEKEALMRLRDLQALMHRNPNEARKVMETVLDGPLQFKPIQTKKGPRYEIRGPLAFGELLGVDGVQYCQRPQRDAIFYEPGSSDRNRWIG
jgi:site-specific DNA recombinase